MSPSVAAGMHPGGGPESVSAGWWGLQVSAQEAQGLLPLRALIASAERGSDSGLGDGEGFSWSRWQNATLKNLLHFFFFLMPLYPLASAVARLDGRGCWEGWCLGKGISFLWSPGSLTAVTPGLPDTRSWRASRLVCMSLPSHHLCWSF